MGLGLGLGFGLGLGLGLGKINLYVTFFVHHKQGYQMTLYKIDNRQIDSIFIHSV